MEKEIFVQNVKRLCLERDIKPTNACKESGVGGSFLSDIVRGQTPSVTKVQLLAAYLGVTTSELLGEERPTPEDEDGLNVVMVRGSDGSFYERKLSDTQRAMLVQMLDNLKPADDENL